VSDGFRTRDRQGHKRNTAGDDTWYGKWWGGQGPGEAPHRAKARPSTREGLTHTQAEAELRRMIGAIEPALARRERITVAEAGELHVARVRMMGRKRATVQSYDSVVRVQLAPYFGARTLDRIGRREIEGFIAHMARSGRSAKTTRNALGVLHLIFEYARREEWVLANPRYPGCRHAGRDRRDQTRLRGDDRLMAQAINTRNDESPASRVMSEAIELAIEGHSPLPERAAFIDADTPGIDWAIDRAIKDDLAVVLVSVDGSTRVLRAEPART
jgi:hypothetical protein